MTRFQSAASRARCGLLATFFLGAAMTTTSPAAEIERRPFGKLADGTLVEQFTLRSARGLEAHVISYGGIIVSLLVPDGKGGKVDVVLGFDTLDEYVKSNPFFGCLVGRYANRIAKGRFTLDGKEYRLVTNNGPNHLHGGTRGFDKVVWKATPRVVGDEQSLELTYVSPDGEEGYPGTLTTTVTYTVTKDDALKIDYHATTDKPTVLNLSQHSYFNLRGAGDGDVMGHEIEIAAKRFTPVDASLIPTGELRAVAGTPLDFIKSRVIGERIAAKDEQLAYGEGYDFNYVLDSGGGALALAARVKDPASGRTMEVRTTEPAVQFYTGNHMPKTIVGKGKKTYGFRQGFCLETQHFPDSPNHPAFPSVRLDPGKDYRQTTVYRFTW
jgi:aldose 1-epimerase